LEIITRYWRIRETFRGTWLKTRRRGLLVHGLIVVAFVLYCLFVAPPIFDRLERTEGESMMHAIPLPAATDSIEYGVEFININGSEAVLRGWAFIRGQDMVGSQIFLVLKSGSDTYIFDTVPWSKPLPVMENYGDLNLNLDDSGFFAILPLRKISDGEYTYGVYIKKDDAGALQYTDIVVTKAGSGATSTRRT
jgi:hypothetical protein